MAPSSVLVRSVRTHAGEAAAPPSPVTPHLALNSEDARLEERIKRALHGAGYRILRDVEVRVDARVVRLVGSVPTYFLKQIAQVSALAVPGAHQIYNDLAVTQ